MPEFIRVVYVADREVFVDGESSGRTNETVRVERGTHTVNLGDPRDYDPKWRRPQVKNTSPIKPLEVTFAKL